MAFSRLQACGCHTLPVIHGERLVGLLTMDHVGESLKVSSHIACHSQQSLRHWLCGFSFHDGRGDRYGRSRRTSYERQNQ